jgi:type VI secretion system secreted protein Hcp
MSCQHLMTMRFGSQGKIASGSIRGKNNGLDSSRGVEVHAFSFGVNAQFDPNSGSVTGKRQHNPIVVRKDVDASSPLLWQMAVTSENIPTIKLSYQRTGSNGKPTLTHTIELTNASIVNVRRMRGSNRKGWEDVTLAYQDLSINGVPSEDHALLRFR